MYINSESLKTFAFYLGTLTSTQLEQRRCRPGNRRSRFLDHVPAEPDHLYLPAKPGHEHNVTFGSQMMKKIIRMFLIAFLFVLLGGSVRAESPYTTWALGPGGYAFMTQDAYTPFAEVDLPISGAEDMFITPDGTIYHCRYRQRADREAGGFRGHGDLWRRDPARTHRPVCRSKGTMYVADAKQNAIVILDATATC